MIPLDYHIHVIAHGEYEYTQDWLDLYIESARRKGMQAIGLAEHDEFQDRVKREILDTTTLEGIEVACGLEFDYYPEREAIIKQMIQQSSPDFVIGSVHHINGWAFDHPDHKHRYEEFDIDQVYRDYYNLVDNMARSAIFDIVGHIDLVKLWGNRPVTSSELQYAEPVLKSIKASGMVIEINSAGLRKPVNEIYPAVPMIERIYQLGIPVTMGSDAHHPDQVGEELDLVSRVLTRIGCRQVTGFRKRKPFTLPLT